MVKHNFESFSIEAGQIDPQPLSGRGFVTASNTRESPLALCHPPADTHTHTHIAMRLHQVCWLLAAVASAAPTVQVVSDDSSVTLYDKTASRLVKRDASDGNASGPFHTNAYQMLQLVRLAVGHISNSDMGGRYHDH